MEVAIHVGGQQEDSCLQSSMKMTDKYKLEFVSLFSCFWTIFWLRVLQRWHFKSEISNKKTRYLNLKRKTLNFQTKAEISLRFCQKQKPQTHKRKVWIVFIP